MFLRRSESMKQYATCLFLEYLHSVNHRLTMVIPVPDGCVAEYYCYLFDPQLLR